MATKQGYIPKIDINIVDSAHNYGDNVTRFDWKSMINGGFIVKCTLIDPSFQTIDKILDEGGGTYLQNARKKPTPMRFRMKWDNGASTPWRNGIVAELDATGKWSHGYFTFIAVDPISYYLNWGDASGKALYGKIGGANGVIKQTLDKYVPSTFEGCEKPIDIVKEVDETTDNPTNWWMMRQDPKTFISSLLEWSSSFTKNKTSWIVSNGENNGKISIKIQETYNSDLQKVSPGLPHEGSAGNTDDLIFTLDDDIRTWNLSCDHLLSTYNTKLVTSGISAVSGEYFDPISDPAEEFVFVTDKNTKKKLRPPIKVNQGFSKPQDETLGWSYVNSIPEFSNAEPSMWYKDYISGRARQQYVSMLYGVMKAKITVKGEPRLYESGDLGQSRVLLNWLNDDKQTKMMHGKWLLYGWHHKYSVTAGTWNTDVYLSRMDWNARGTPPLKAK